MLFKNLKGNIISSWSSSFFKDVTFTNRFLQIKSRKQLLLSRVSISLVVLGVEGGYGRNKGATNAPDLVLFSCF